MESNRMTILKKCVSVAVVFLTITVVLSAYDFGLIISNNTGFSKATNMELNQSNTASVWFSQKITDTIKFYGSGLYDFTYFWAEDDSSIVPYQFDLGLTYLTGVTKLGSSVTEWSIGRIVPSDITGKVMSGNADGLSADFYINKVNIGIGAYYSGFVVKGNSGVSVSPLDAQDSVNDDILFAPNRLLYKCKLGVTQGPFGQDVTFEVVGQNDFRKDVSAEEKLDTYYSTLMLSGVPFPLTSFVLGITTGIQKNDDLSFAQMAFSNVTVYIPWKNTSFSWDAFYTGAIGNTGDGFHPITTISVSSIQPSIIAENILSTSIDLSSQIVKWLTTGMTAGTFFRTTDCEVSAVGFDVDSEDKYLGSEGSLYMNMELSSELEIYCTGGIFWANINLEDSGISNPLYRASLSVSFKI